MKLRLREIMPSLTDDPIWICQVKSNYRRLRCRLSLPWGRRSRSAAPAQRRKAGI